MCAINAEQLRQMRCVYMLCIIIYIISIALQSIVRLYVQSVHIYTSGARFASEQA